MNSGLWCSAYCSSSTLGSQYIRCQANQGGVDQRQGVSPVREADDGSRGVIVAPWNGD